MRLKIQTLSEDMTKGVPVTDLSTVYRYNCDDVSSKDLGIRNQAENGLRQPYPQLAESSL